MNEFKINMIKALAHPIRIQILKMLYDGPICVCKLDENIDCTQANTSQHLKLLRDARLVKTEKRGLYQYYGLNSDKIKDLIDMIEEIYEEVN